MAAIQNEDGQWIDETTNTLIVNGYIYIGQNGQDPVTTAASTTIYSNRGLSTAISNPQRTGSDGRSVNKIWVDGKYSIEVQDSAAVQKYNSLDAGELASVGNTALDNVSGTDTIVATANPTITALTANQTYIFTTAGANTGAVTLNIDSIGAKTLKKNHDVDLISGDLEANQVVSVVYNSTDDVFEVISNTLSTSFDSIQVTNVATFSGAANFSKGSDVASAATCDIWVTDGNEVTVTGSTGPITSFGTAPNTGADRWVTFASTPTITNSANLAIQGGKDITVIAGDKAYIKANDSTTQLDVIYFRMSVNKYKETFVTATDATWTPTPGVVSISFQAVGGGGGGGGVDGQGVGTNASAAGGGGGGTEVKTTSTIDATYAITIGPGGSGGAAGNNNGSAGTDTTVIGSTGPGTNMNLTASAGAGGEGFLGTSGNGRAIGGDGAGGTGGDYSIRGGDGFFGFTIGGERANYGHGGSTSLSGSEGCQLEGAGITATNGGGGSGATALDVTNNYSGGDGGDGVVIVREYF